MLLLCDKTVSLKEFRHKMPKFIIIFYFEVNVLRLRFSALVIIFLTVLCAFSFSISAKEISLFVNDKKIECDAPPTIQNDRTLVPVRAIMEAFNATVKWNDLTKSVTVSHNGINVVLTINSKKAKVGTVLSFLDCEPIIIDNRTFVPVRFIAETFKFNVKWDNTNYAVLISAIPPPELSTSTETPDNNDVKNEDSVLKAEPEKYTNKITNIKTSFSSGRFCIKITTTEPVSEHKIFPLSNPERIVIDLKDCVYGNAGTISVNNRGITSVRFGSQEYGLRIVTDIVSATTYNFKFSADKRILYVYIDEISDDNNKNTEANNQNNITSDKNNEEPDNQTTITKPDTNDSLSDETNNELPLEKEIITSVVIDAGHGGSDTGAIGYDENGNAVLYEKDVNLKVAKEVVALLHSKGIEVHSTRSSDVYVPLAGRTTFANTKGATLFVSIHSNSFTSPDANGTLTIYSKSKDETYKNKMPSKDIADIIQKDLYKVLETYNRGITSEDDLYVLRNSEMPAVLIELAFISNESDRAILADDTAMSAAAQSIANSIESIIKNQEKEGL